MLPWLLRIWRQLPAPLRNLYLRFRYGQFAVGLAALIRDEHGRILVVHRTYSRDEPWALPGGWLELGDVTLEHALERELHEETGLRVKVGGVHSVQRSGFAVVVLLDAALADPVEAFRPSPEVCEIAWVEPEEMDELSGFNARLVRRAVHPEARPPRGVG